MNGVKHVSLLVHSGDFDVYEYIISIKMSEIFISSVFSALN